MATEAAHAPPHIETPRFSMINWKGRTEDLLNSLDNSSRSLGSSVNNGEFAKKTKEGTTKLLGKVVSAGENSKKGGHILKLRAGITVWEREIAKAKHNFGLELFSIMDRNRNMGDKSGGEAEPELVEIYTNCISNVMALLELRKRKQTELIQIIKPQAICYQSNADETTESLVTLENSTSEENEDENEELNAPSGLQLWFATGVESSRKIFEKNTMKNTLKSEIAELDKDLDARKAQFGVDMYDTMEYLGEQYEARDVEIRNLYEGVKKDIDVPMLKRLTAEKEIDDVRTAGVVLVSREELKEFVDQNPLLWAMLGANIGLGEEQCKMICVRVITELVSGLHGKEAREAVIKKRQFLRFEQRYIKNSKGAQDFFHRCVFAAFDTDHNGTLDQKETDEFIDAFYGTGSIFLGDNRLPEKEDLKIKIIESLDENEDGQFTFEEIGSLISGTANGKKNNGLLSA